MSAEKCADIIMAGYEQGSYKIFVPGHMNLLTMAPQWISDLIIAKNQKKLFTAMLEAVPSKM
jgi:hypothetical protein